VDGRAAPDDGVAQQGRARDREGRRRRRNLVRARRLAEAQQVEYASPQQGEGVGGAPCKRPHPLLTPAQAHGHEHGGEHVAVHERVDRRPGRRDVPVAEASRVCTTC